MVLRSCMVRIVVVYCILYILWNRTGTNKNNNSTFPEFSSVSWGIDLGFIFNYKKKKKKPPGFHLLLLNPIDLKLDLKLYLMSTSVNIFYSPEMSSLSPATFLKRQLTKHMPFQKGVFGQMGGKGRSFERFNAMTICPTGWITSFSFKVNYSCLHTCVKSCKMLLVVFV